MKFTRQKAEIDAEKDLLTGLIVSDRFCKTVLPVIKPHLLQVDIYKTIVRWINDYFKQYDKSPGIHLEKIYKAKREEFKEEDRDSLELILKTLSERYEEKDNFNIDYYIDESILYLKKQSLLHHSETIKTLVEIGDINGAEKETVDYHKVAKSTSSWHNPYDPTYIENYFLKSEEYLFQFPGVLGHVLGRFKRKQFVGVMGPMKKGKSFYLDEFRHIALLSRLKVVFVSLEMDHEEISGRGYKRLTGQAEDKEIFIYPVFDCLHNQYDTCNKGFRTNLIKLVNNEGEKPPFNPENPYKPCIVCRNRKERSYQPEVWYERSVKPKLTISQMKKKAKGVMQMYGDMFRIISHPIDTVNIKDIERDLDLLAWTEKFIPDVIIIDYADILKKEDGREQGRDAINTTWKTLRSLSQRRNCLVVTGTQSNRASFDKKRVKATDTGEDIRKLAHVTAMMVLNQTPFEKRYGIMRIGLVALRSEGFDEMTQVQVLQDLTMGQTHLDSEIVRTRKEVEDESNVQD